MSTYGTKKGGTYRAHAQCVRSIEQRYEVCVELRDGTIWYGRSYPKPGTAKGVMNPVFDDAYSEWECQGHKPDKEPVRVFVNEVELKVESIRQIAERDAVDVPEIYKRRHSR